MLYVMLAISIVGAILGATPLLLTPPAAFNRLIPWLLLFATVTFAASPLLTKAHDGDPTHQCGSTPHNLPSRCTAATSRRGSGIIMLALLAFSGLAEFQCDQRHEERARGRDQRLLASTLL